MVAIAWLFVLDVTKLSLRLLVAIALGNRCLLFTFLF